MSDYPTSWHALSRTVLRHAMELWFSVIALQPHRKTTAGWLESGNAWHEPLALPCIPHFLLRMVIAMLYSRRTQ